jgi:predicted GIY-YIG superfamily endonuclease
MDHVPGTVYLLHLDKRLKHAGHYLGWAKDLDKRLEHHANGTGANFLRVVKDAGIGWTLARTWPGDKYRERQLKRQGGRSRMCPICKTEAKAAKREKEMTVTSNDGGPYRTDEIVGYVEHQQDGYHVTAPGRDEIVVPTMSDALAALGTAEQDENRVPGDVSEHDLAADQRSQHAEYPHEPDPYSRELEAG